MDRSEEKSKWIRSTLAARFWSKVISTANGCALWKTGTPRAIPSFMVDFKNGKIVNRKISQVGWELHNGVLVPDGQMIRQTCGDRRCVAKDHLVLFDAWRNTQAAVENQQKPTKESDLRRFMDKIQKLPPDNLKEGCWMWMAAYTGNYGSFHLCGRPVSAHQASLELHVGPNPDPERLIVLHACDHTYCVNPAHLSYGTLKENSEDMVSKGRHRGSAKMTPEIVGQIKAEYVKRDGELKRLAIKYDSSVPTISAIVTGQNWAHIKVELGSKADLTLVNHRASSGEGHHNSKLTEADVRDIRAALKAGVTQLAIVDVYGLQPAQVSSIATGKAWSHLEAQ